MRVVTDPRRADLSSRSILVAEHTDPGWIMVFPAALGVLVERGSVLSHAAIVARELGIPAVVSLPGVTDWLRDGDWIEMDGSKGVVRRVARPQDTSEPSSASKAWCPCVVAHREALCTVEARRLFAIFATPRSGKTRTSCSRPRRPSRRRVRVHRVGRRQCAGPADEASRPG